MRSPIRSTRWRWITSGIAAVMLAALITGSVVAASAAAPVNTKEPSITGSATVGTNLAGNRGTWTGVSTYAYKWLRCNSSAANCAAIGGATGEHYTTVSADIGATIRFEVTGSNSDGSKTADSNATGVITTASGVPSNSSPPTITGTTTVGSTLTSGNGVWVGDAPITYSYQWLKCDKNGNACKNIGKATSATYKLTQGEAGSTIRIKVTAKNTRGKANANSVPTAVVTGAGSGGGTSVDVKDVPKGERLIVETVTFSPNPVKSRSKPITVTILVKDTRGNLVRNALVFIRSTPILTSTPTDSPTGADGKVTYSITPTSSFPLKNGHNVQFFVKAYRKGDPTLAGISGTRLVQVATAK